MVTLYLPCECAGNGLLYFIFICFGGFSLAAAWVIWWLLERPDCNMSFAFLFVDAGQSKCRLERAQALEQAKKPQEAVFIPECNEDGSFMQVKFLFASFSQALGVCKRF